MKRVSLSILFACFFCQCSFAQTVPINPRDINRSGQTNVDPDRVRTLRPADLQVTECSIVSTGWDDVKKKFFIQVSFKIKNTGELPAGATTLKAFYKIPSSTGTTYTCSSSLPVGRLANGQVFGKVYTFYEPIGRFRRGQQVDFWMKADTGNAVAESVETNNQSALIIITVPVR